MPDGERALSAPVVADGVAIVVGEDLVYGVDASTGDPRWQLRRAGGSILAAAAVAEVDGSPVVLYTRSSSADSSYLVAYSIGGSVPSPLWKVKLQDRVTGGVTVDGDLALVGDVSGNVYAVKLDATSHPGEELEPEWRAEVPGVVDSAVAAEDGRVYVTARSTTSQRVQVVALGEEDGKTVWSFLSTSAAYGTPPTVAADDVVVGLSDGTVVALSAEEGSEVWSVRLRSQFVPFSAIAFSEGHLLALPSRVGESGLYRIDATDGSRSGPWHYGDGLWDFEFSQSTLFTSPLVIGDTVYAGFDGGMLAAVDQATGIETWTYDTGNRPVRGLAPGDGLLIASIGSRRGGLAAYGHTEGALTHVVSGTKPAWGRMLGNYAIAFGLVGAVAALLFLLLRLRGGPRRTVIPEPADDLGPVAGEGPA